MNQRIYLDNAATTPLDPEVLEAMMPYLTDRFGNPSAVYSYGRESRLAIETARKSVARTLNAHPSEIFFTSGGTESTNTSIWGAVNDLGCMHIITSPIEHHATLHTVERLHDLGKVQLSYVKLRSDGHIDADDLEQLLRNNKQKTLVTLMHANNEIGNMLDLEAIGKLCAQYGAIFHSDTVQTIGHFPLDLRNTAVQFATAAGHKFHGPKGVGMLFVSNAIKINALIHGGGQERNMRSGTENLYGIVGFAKALELATARMEQDSAYIRSLKAYMMEKLQEQISDVQFNGDPRGRSLYTVLSVSFPKTEKSEMLLYNLDINHICASGGSACASGTEQGSHVIRAIAGDSDRVTVRFSFSRHNNANDIDTAIRTIGEVM